MYDMKMLITSWNSSGPRFGLHQALQWRIVWYQEVNLVPSIQSLNFSIVWITVNHSFSVVEYFSFAEVSFWLMYVMNFSSLARFPLFQDSSYSFVWWISLNYKWLCKIGSGQDRNRNYKSFKLVKCWLGGYSPFKGFFCFA